METMNDYSPVRFREPVLAGLLWTPRSILDTMSRNEFSDAECRIVQNQAKFQAVTRKTKVVNRSDRIDRRVARTRALLQDSLVALTSERGYAGITVEDICARANVGRSTFYTHYAGKDELRGATMDAHLRELGKRPRPVHNPDPGGRVFEFSLPMFEHAQTFRALHRALLAPGGDAIRDELRKRVQRVVCREVVDQWKGASKAQADFAVQFTTGALLAVLTWWTTTDVGLSPREVDDLFQGLATNGLRAAPQR
jgi:AcrR family transcriptional regulator